MRVCVCVESWEEAVTSSQSFRQVTNRVCSLPAPILTGQEKLSHYPPFRLEKKEEQPNMGTLEGERGGGGGVVVLCVFVCILVLATY